MLFGETFAGCKRVNSCRNGTPNKLLAQYRFGSTGPRGRISVFEPPLSGTPSSKAQAPEKFRNRNTKNQAPNTKEIPSSKLQTAARASSLELGASLEFGAWCLVFWELVLLWSLEFGIWRFFPGAGSALHSAHSRRCGFAHQE